MTTLQIVWFLLVGVLITGYAVLGGFDLGAGFWHLFVRKDEDRQKVFKAIGPVWDGNEVSLLTGGGAIFAAFPPVYATVFSGLYLAMMLVVFSLILRAVSIEFRNAEASPRWRSAWDKAFAFGSIVPALLFGVAMGNILHGLDLDSTGSYTGSFFSLLNPYSLLIGLVGLAMFATHGAVFLAQKTSGELAAQARIWANRSWWGFIVLFIAASVATFTTHPQLLANFGSVPALWLLPFLVLGAIVLVEVFSRRGETRRAFVASGISIAGLIGIVGASIFPKLVPALGSPDWSLTITNSSSSPLTLKVMLILALIGMPIVLFYTTWIYRTFSGKVEISDTAY